MPLKFFHLWVSLPAAMFLLTLTAMLFRPPDLRWFHVDRARGPFLQAVANGLCLNLLGLTALDSFRRRKLRGIVAGILFLAVPLAILATKTRAVWIASALSVLCLMFFASTLKLRRIA